MKDFKSLVVWQKSHQFVLNMYGVLKQYPADEKFGLITQLKRAVVSIPTNIAEGCGRGTDKDFARFIQMALGSSSEVEYLLLLSYDLSFITNEQFTANSLAVQEIKKMLTALLRSLR